MCERLRRDPRQRASRVASARAAAVVLTVSVVLGAALGVSGCGKSTPAPAGGGTGARSSGQPAVPQTQAPSLDEREPIDRAITLWMRGDHSGALLAVERAAGLPPTSIGEDQYLAMTEAQIASTPPHQIDDLERLKGEHLWPRAEAARAIFKAVLEEVPRRIESSDLEGAQRLRDGMTSLSAWLATPDRALVFAQAGQVFRSLIAERLDPALQRARRERE